MGRPCGLRTGLDSRSERSLFLWDKDLSQNSNRFPTLPTAVAAITILLASAPVAPLANPAPDPADVVRQADAAFDADDQARALTLYQEALAADPDNLRALRRAGLLLGWAGRANEAVPLLEKAVSLEPEDRETQLQLARVYSWDRQWDKSLAAYDALLAKEPGDVSTAVERARVLAWAGRLPASEEAYRQILAAHPDSSEARLGLAQTIRWEGRLDESAALYREELGRSPSGARLGLARIDL